MKTGRLWLILGGLAVVVAGVGLPLAAGRADDNLIGIISTYTTVHEDTLLDVARRFDFGFVELVAANPGVDPWLPGEGVTLLLPARHILPDAPRKGIVVNLTEMRLYYYRQSGMPPETHPVGIGSEGNNTPISTTTVLRKQANPVWYPPAAIRIEKPELGAMVPAGPDNPMGMFALYLGFRGGNWRIHGTNQPFAVGRRVTHGCLRLYPEDIEDMFYKVAPGTQVTIIDQPVKAGWADGELYIEVHPSKAQADQLEEDHLMSEEVAETAVAIAYKAAGEAGVRIDEPTLLRAARERRGYPIRITQ
ncbi:MAG: L,D-transpeptidase family protein [Rhodospirillaceae bacterium]